MASKDNHVNENEILEEVLNLSLMHQKEFENYDQEKKECVLKIKKFVSSFDNHVPQLKSNIIDLHSILNLFQDNYPWIHKSGNKLIDLLEEDHTKEKKTELIESFHELIDFTFDYLVTNKIYEVQCQELQWIANELPNIFDKTIDDEKTSE